MQTRHHGVMSLRIYRVAVRGRFADLTDDARTMLVAEAPERDAVDRAERYLSQRGLGFRDLKVQATDMATVWD